MKFTAHNIKLLNGEKTMGDSVELLEDSAVWKSIKRSVDLFTGTDKEQIKKMRVADLGCLEGGYAVEFAKMGFETIGIEARKENIESCEYVKNNLELPNLKFVLDDVRNIGNYGEFDISLCAGLLYHLDNPSEYLALLSKYTKKMLVLQTHYASKKDFRYNLGFLNRYFIGPIEKRGFTLSDKQNYRLSKLSTHEGRLGRWYREWSPDTDKQKIENLLWASYNNPKSFWMCKNDLIQNLVDVGFDTVFERFDFLGDIASNDYISKYDRSLFIALKTG